MRINIKCKQCGNVFTVREKSNRKFCSLSCSASYGNRARKGKYEYRYKGKVSKRIKRICCYCGNEFECKAHDKKKFCSINCFHKNVFKETNELYLKGDFNDLNRRRQRKRVIFIQQEEKCNNCKLSEWLGKPITLELEHKNGDSQDNTRENLELLCPNCHSYTKYWRIPKKFR